MRIRPAWPRDLEACIGLDHAYGTDHVWQMETRADSSVLTTTFRLARLPRKVWVEYPRKGEEHFAGSQRCDGFLVAVVDGGLRGYVALTAQKEHGTMWVNGLVVDQAWRRQGIGTGLLRSALEWGRDQKLVRLVVGIQTKNCSAVRFCRACGLTFCGYDDHYGLNQDIVMFQGISL